MTTTGSKFAFGSAVLALIAAFFVAVSTVGREIGMAELTGPISIGWKGPVGNHVAYAILLAYAAAALLLGAVLSTVRDGDPEEGARLQGLTEPVAVLPPRGTNYWPPIAAVGVAMVVIGLVGTPELFILGLIVIGVSGLQWTIYAWSDRATADPFANRNVRHQLVYPMDFPLFAIVAIFLFVMAISRILLALPEGADTAVFGAVPFVAFVVAIFLSFRPDATRRVITTITVLSVLAVLAMGIYGFAKGPKSIEKHENTPHRYNIPEASFGAAAAPMTVHVTGEEIS